MKCLFDLHSHMVIHHQMKSTQELKQDTILEAGVKTEAMKRNYLQACFSWFAQPTFYRSQDQQPRVSTIQHGLGHFLLIIN